MDSGMERFLWSWVCPVVVREVDPVVYVDARGRPLLGEKWAL